MMSKIIYVDVQQDEFFLKKNRNDLYKLNSIENN